MMLCIFFITNFLNFFNDASCLLVELVALTTDFETSRTTWKRTIKTRFAHTVQILDCTFTSEGTVYSNIVVKSAHVHDRMVSDVLRFNVHSICHSLKKSLPLLSTTINAGKFSTSIFHTASIPIEHNNNNNKNMCIITKLSALYVYHLF